LKAEKGEEGNVLGALFTLGELREDQESLPSSAVSHSDTFQTRSQAVQEAFGDAPSAHDGYGTEVLIGEIGKRKEDAHGEDPFRDVEGNKLSGLNLGGPFVKGEKLVGREHVDGIDGERDDQGKPEVAVGERREARGGLEIIETLETRLMFTAQIHVPLRVIVLTMKSHFCSGWTSTSRLPCLRNPIVWVARTRRKKTG
jgi:hypothetical protein